MYRQPITPLALIIALVFAVGGCMGDDDEAGGENGEPTPTPITAESVLESASAEWSETGSGHFTLAVEGDAFLDRGESIKLISAEGDILRPDSVEATAKIGVGGFTTVDVSMIAIGDQMYMTNFVSGRWEEAPEDFDYNPAVLFSDSEGIGPVLQELRNPELEGTERLDGTEAHVVTGTVSGEAVQEITAGAIEGEQIDVTLWIGVEDAKLLQVKLVEPPGIRETPATWTLRLTNHNQDIEIEAPQV